MVEKGNKGEISPRLLRFLMTTVRRSSIGRIRLAAVMIRNGRIGLDDSGKLPGKESSEDEMEESLEELARDFGVEDISNVRYIGYFDHKDGERVVRQFNFEMPCGVKWARFVAVAKAEGLLDKGEAKAVKKMLRERTIVLKCGKK